MSKTTGDDPPMLPPRRRRLLRNRGARLYESLSFPFLVVAVLYNPRINAAYEMTWPKKFRLAWRMRRTTKGVDAATSYRAHLAMAVKLLEMAPSDAVVVECGCFLGASAANLSLVCDIVGRDLILYDSFEGLPPPAKGEKYGNPFAAGLFKGELEAVQANIRKYGTIERCVFRKGWFKYTLPNHEERIALAFFDVDFQDSLHDCMIGLWPHLVNRGYLFIDEYVFTDYCALFYSEKYWKRYFDTVPPGLVGAGSGIPLGQVMLDAWPPLSPLQFACSIAYTRKGWTGFWDFYPEEIAEGTAPDEVLNRGSQ
jgi:O-methyltransferase